MAKDKKQKEKKSKLTPQQELFCRIYSTQAEFFGNGTQSYIQAYKIKAGGENGARASAGALLTNPNILARINELLDLVLTDATADKELAFVMTQKQDFGAKIQGIREYNRLKGRINQKIEIKGTFSLSELLDAADQNQKG